MPTTTNAPANQGRIVHYKLLGECPERYKGCTAPTKDQFAEQQAARIAELLDERDALIKELTSKTVFYVAGVNQAPLRHCVWGFFHELDRALESARSNETDINEAGYYPLALVTEVEPGMVSMPINSWWFEFDGSAYKPIGAPEWAANYGWVGFPRVPS